MTSVLHVKTLTGPSFCTTANERVYITCGSNAVRSTYQCPDPIQSTSFQAALEESEVCFGRGWNPRNGWDDEKGAKASSNGESAVEISRAVPRESLRFWLPSRDHLGAPFATVSNAPQ